MTPLHIAAKAARLSTCEILLQANAIPTTTDSVSKFIKINLKLYYKKKSIFSILTIIFRIMLLLFII